MSRRMIRSGFVYAVATLVAATVANVAGATGYWNMPCTACQWWGHGFGGGYHAPLMLGPATHECCSRPNEVRLPYAPNPYACAPYCNGGGYGGYPVNRPATMAPQHQNPPILEPPVQEPPTIPQEGFPAGDPDTSQYGPQMTAPNTALFAPPVQIQGRSW